MRITIKNRIQSNLLAIAVICLGLGQIFHKISVNNKFEEINARIDDNAAAIALTCGSDSCPIPSKLMDNIQGASALPIDITNAIIAVESGGKPNAYNKKEGAIGLMQIRPVVYKKLCGLTKQQAFDPVMNVGCGSLYMKSLLEKYQGNLERALVFYNSGTAMIDTGYAEKVKDQINEYNKPQRKFNRQKVR